MFSEAGGSTLTRHKNVKGKQAFTGVRAPGGLPSFPEPVSRASGTVVIFISLEKTIKKAQKIEYFSGYFSIEFNIQSRKNPHGLMGHPLLHSCRKSRIQRINNS